MATSDERKLATLLFADLVGSTELGGAQDPERTRALLDRFYDAMVDEIERAGGTIEKFAGDAVMAAFGVPTALEDHAERALHAALAMRHRVRKLDPRLELRIGVNTGEVVAAPPRAGSSFVTGDPVNVAARLEQGAEPGEILVGDCTVDSVRGAFEFDDERTIEAKGKPGGIRCHRLARALSLMRPRGVSGLERSFVGRDAELERLLGAYRRAADERRPRLVTVVGDAGLGKTRLARELWERLQTESPPPLRRTGRCLSYGAGIAYWALGEVLREQFGLLESDPPERALERLGERQILGLALGLDAAGDLHPLAVRDRFQDAWADFVTAVAAEQPMVVLIEDLHWADDQLLDLLEHVLVASDGPLLLVATARPELLERRPGWGMRALSERLELDPLSPEESVRMLDELLAGGLPTKLRELVVERAEGNPFFVEELLGMLIDRGTLKRASGDWSLDELPPGFAVPDSVHAVLAARIDLLEPAEKAALQAAAVIGRVFWAGPVYLLVEGEPNLRVLEERDLIRRRGGSTMAGEREYAIKHALTREVAYASLPKARRAHLHAAFADWLEHQHGGRDEDAPLLAHHYRASVRPEDEDLVWLDDPAERERLRTSALAWLERAADLAVDRYEIDDAISLLRDALELQPDKSAAERLWRKLGEAAVLKYDGETFWQAMERALELADDPAEQADILSTLAIVTGFRAGMWTERPGSKRIEAWIAGALERAEPESRARARALVARAWLSPPGEERPGTREAVELGHRVGDPAIESQALAVETEQALHHHRYGEALELARQNLQLAGSFLDPDAAATLRQLSVAVLLACGEVTQAGDVVDEYERDNAKLSSHHAVHGVSIRLDVEELRGNWSHIRDLLPLTRERIEANLATPCVNHVRGLLICATAHAAAGDQETARSLEREAATHGYEMDDHDFDAPRVRLAIARGDLDAVAALVSGPLAPRRNTFWVSGIVSAQLDALTVLGDETRIEQEAPPFARPGTSLEPFALRALGVARADPGLIDQACERFDELGFDWHAAQTDTLLASSWRGRTPRRRPPKERP
jgi:class 3 adenylate cyclase